MAQPQIARPTAAFVGIYFSLCWASVLQLTIGLWNATLLLVGAAPVRGCFGAGGATS